MFGWFKREKIILRDETAQRICDLLFPEHEEKEEDGQKFIIDYSVDMNLQSALYDLDEGENDEVTRNTIRDAIKRLTEAREILYANKRVKKGVHYLVVDTPDNRPD